jgi:hypothetical protein
MTAASREECAPFFSDGESHALFDAANCYDIIGIRTPEEA